MLIASGCYTIDITKYEEPRKQKKVSFYVSYNPEVRQFYKDMWISDSSEHVLWLPAHLVLMDGRSRINVEKIDCGEIVYFNLLAKDMYLIRYYERIIGNIYCPVSSLNPINICIDTIIDPADGDTIFIY